MTLALVCLGTVSSQEFLRDLQSVPAPATYVAPSKALRYYGDDLKIAYTSTLGCGACITGSYIYCILGKEGADYSG